MPSKDTREEAMTTAEHRKESKAKRKLEVNVQPRKLKV